MTANDGHVEPVAPQLSFVEPVGDDDVACQGTARCAFFISYTEQRPLEVVYTEDGEPVTDQVVSFEIVDDPGELGHLSDLSANTDTDGVAGVQVAAAQSSPGQFAVKATVDHDGVPPLFFDVVVSPQGKVALTVVAEYEGSNVEVTHFTVRLFRQDGSGQPSCDAPEQLYENETADWESAPAPLSQPVSKKEFDGLQGNGVQMYTILAVSESPDGSSTLARGCDDENGLVEWGFSRTVEVELFD